MPLPNSGFSVMTDIQQYLVNKDDGTPLSGGYILFWKDKARTVPKDVFVQVQAPGPTYNYVDIGSQVTLSSVGTTQYLGTDSIIFMYPYVELPPNGITLETYYLQVFSSDNELQFVRENWPPGAVAGSTATGSNQSQNIISNPQFSNVLFDTVNGATINVTGTQTTAIAPDWNVITTGTGTFTVNQTALTDTTIPGEPAYALDINSASLDSIILSQRITNSPRILEGSFACGTIVAKAVSPSVNVTLSMDYVSSLPQSTPIFSGLAGDGAFAQLKNTTSAAIPQTNTNAPGASGYVDIQITIPPGAHVQISCVQLVSVADGTISVDYIQESTPRQVDHLFHYYQQLLNFKPIPSLLTGWDFALNPAQWGSTQTISTTPSYIWDQTIAACSAGTVAVTAAITGIFPVMQCVTGSNTQAFYLLQYLQGAQAFETAISNLSVNINAYANIHPGVVVSVYLCAGNASSTIPATATPLGTIAADGTFALTSDNWSFIPQPQGQSFYTTISNLHLDYGFNGWVGDAVLGTRLNFAIVVTFAVPTSGTQVIIESISCVPGDIPTRPAPLTPTDVLNQCKYYWQQSFLPGVVPAQNVGINSGESYGVQGSTGASGNTGPLVRFPIEMRALPTLTFYNPLATNAQIANITGSSSCSSTSALNIQLNGFATRCTGNAGSSNGDTLGLHWTSNARLGDV